MTRQRITSFAEFWPFYVREHSLAATRTFHFIGTSLAFIAIILTATTTQWWYLLAGLVVSYGFAWFSHFFIEKNRPATFTYPLYSLRADLRMYGLMLRGRMQAEVVRSQIA
jgi:hypothetical protein